MRETPCPKVAVSRSRARTLKLARSLTPILLRRHVPAAGQGTGLGLAAVYGIVRQHGGFIGVTGEPGRGTIFYIDLPTVARVSQPPESVTAEQLIADTGTIPVAEDFEDLLELAYELLVSWGYHVILANDGQEALRLFKTNAEDIQLVVLDVVMPRLGGVGAIFLPKPCMPEALCRTVLSTLRKRALDPLIAASGQVRREA